MKSLKLTPSEIELVNLTPHTVNFLDATGRELLAVPPSGTPARVLQACAQVGELSVAGVVIPVNVNIYGSVEHLPKPAEGVRYLVSAMVAQAARDRKDLLLVDDTVRDPAGRIVGCRAVALGPRVVVAAPGVPVS